MCPETVPFPLVHEDMCVRYIASKARVGEVELRQRIEEEMPAPQFENRGSKGPVRVPGLVRHLAELLTVERARLDKEAGAEQRGGPDSSGSVYVSECIFPLFAFDSKKDLKREHQGLQSLEESPRLRWPFIFLRWLDAEAWP